MRNINKMLQMIFEKIPSTNYSVRKYKEIRLICVTKLIVDHSW